MPDFTAEPTIARDDDFLLLSWEHFGLKSEFPFIEPASRIGRLLIQLHNDFEIADEELEDIPYTDTAGFIEVQANQELTSRKLNLVKSLTHYIGKFNGSSNISATGGIELLDLFRGSSTTERLRIEASKGLNEEGLAELQHTIDFAHIYLFADDWDSRKGNYPT